MKIFRVITERPGRPLTDRNGVQMEREESLYAAPSFERVYAEVQEMLKGPWAGLCMDLIKIEEAAPAVFILEDKPEAA